MIRQTTTLNGKVVTLEEFYAAQAALNERTPEQLSAAARNERMAESYSPRFRGNYSNYHFSLKRAL